MKTLDSFECIIQLSEQKKRVIWNVSQCQSQPSLYRIKNLNKYYPQKIVYFRYGAESQNDIESNAYKREVANWIANSLRFAFE